MKSRSIFTLALFQTIASFLFSEDAARAAIPLLINHQGVINVSGVPFNGNGDFRFSFVDPDTNLNRWTNDGSKVNLTGTPNNAVNLPVINGIYNVRLGDVALAQMVAIPSAIFDDDNLILRIWFNDGVNGNRQLSPDQTVTSAAYAFHALLADQASTALDTDSKVSTHNTSVGAHANIQLDGARITSGKIDNTRLNTGTGNGLDADTVDGVHASTLEESAEVTAAVSAHDSNAAAHTNLQIAGAQITSGKIDNTRLNTGSGNGLDADTVDGYQAVTFLTSAQASPFYRAGLEPYFVSPTTIKVTPGAIDLGGTVLSMSAFSSVLDLNNTAADWANGSKTNSKFAYLYGFNNSGSLGFKFSNEAPDLSDSSGNTDLLPHRYQRYPDSAGGIYYRCIGKIMIDGSGDIDFIKAFRETDPASLFSRFGGDGTDGDFTSSGDNSFDSTPRQFNTFTLNVGHTITVSDKVVIIGVRGRCEIHGTINGKLAGASPGRNALDSSVGNPSGRIAYCVTGAGGGGNSTSAGGAGGDGGGVMTAGGVTPTWRKTAISTALREGSVSGTELIGLVSCVGAGGSQQSGGTSGGGCIYIECDELVFDGSLLADSLYAGGQGGGGGGAVVVRARKVLDASGNVSVVGGGGDSGVGAAGFSAVAEE
jgi:hypothetical protein